MTAMTEAEGPSLPPDSYDADREGGPRRRYEAHDRSAAFSDADARPRRGGALGVLVAVGKGAGTLVLLAAALVAGFLIWDYYVTAPWTRDGRVRVQVASVAPQVSGQITELRVHDNEYVRRGDLLYVIDRFDFKRTLESAKAILRQKAADLQVKQVQADRRIHLSSLATTAEEQQSFIGTATQAQATFDGAQQEVDQAAVNLQRTEVRSPVNGYVTNLLMRVGDYAHAGTANVSIVDAASYWVDGYFEETKMGQVCVGDHAEARLMGYARPIGGEVESVTRGISVSDATPSTQGLPSVDPIYTWVRLAQRVPVRIRITHVPAGVPLVSGMTATVTILQGGRPDALPSIDRLASRWAGLRTKLAHLLDRPQPRVGCLPVREPDHGVSDTISSDEPPPARGLAQINPGLVFDMTGRKGPR